MPQTADPNVWAQGIEAAVGDRARLEAIKGELRESDVPEGDVQALEGRIDTYLGDLDLSEGLPPEDD